MPQAAFTSTAQTTQPTGHGPRVRYAPSDVAPLLWRERGLMVWVFVALTLVGLTAMLVMVKTDYPVHSSLLIRLGQDYVYQPQVGDAARGAVPDNDQVVRSEVEILTSRPLRERVLARLGYTGLFPKRADKFAAAEPAARALMIQEAVEAIGKRLKVASAPGASVVTLDYKASDPKVAARVLNCLMEEYLLYRRSVLVSDGGGALERQRQAFEGQLAKADAAFAGFLTSNGIGDFAAQKTALGQLQAQVEAQKYQVDIQLQDRAARLSALNAELARTASEVGLYRDVNSAALDRLAALRLEREGLLSRYKEGAEPVRENAAQIAQLEQGLAQGRTVTDGPRRYGANPVYQTLQTERAQLVAETAALRESQTALAGQIDQVGARLLRMAELEPQFQSLSLERDVLQGNVRDFTVKSQQDEAQRNLAAEGDDSVRIIERASPPLHGSSLRKPLLVLVVLMAAFTALCAGLFRAFLRPGVPTAASAERTFGLPVLGTAALKA